MATELIQDFSEGIDNTLAPNRIGLKQLATATDVWYDKNAIKVRGGIDNTNITVESGRSIAGWGRTSVLNLGGTDYVFVRGTFSPVSGNAPLVPMYSSNGTTFTLVKHGTGTATTNGTATVTGSGTSWSTHLRANDVFRIDARTQMVQISSVDSDTQITLVSAYSTSESGAAYSVYPYFSSGKGNGTSYEQLNNLIYMSDGIRTPGNWNGTVFNTTTNFPLAFFIVAFKNYMFAADTTANPSRVFWSTLKTPETWPASNFIDVNPDDGQRITGLFDDGNSLLILKKRSIYRLSGDIFDPSNPTYTLTKLYTPPECQFNSSRSWSLFEGRYVLWGGTGLYEYTLGNFISRIPVSEKLLTTFTSSGWTSATGSGALENDEAGQQAITYNGRLWMTSFGPGGNGPTLVLERNGSPWLFRSAGSDPAIFSPFMLPASNNYNTLWCLTHNSGSGAFGVAKLDQAVTVESMAPSFTTRVIEYKNRQRFGRAYLHFKKQSAGTINFGYKIDEGSTNTVSVDMTAGTGTRLKSQIIMIGQVGKSIQFVISKPSDTNDFEVYAIEFERQDLRQ